MSSSQPPRDRCPVCGSAENEPLWTWNPEPFLRAIDVDRRQDVVICAVCGIVYRSPPLERALLDALHEKLDLELHDDEDFRDRADWLRSRLPGWKPGLRALEIGCAKGRMLELLREAGIEAHGVDPNPGAVRSARERGFQVYEGYVEDIDLPRGSYDVILFMHLLEHLDDPLAFLEKTGRLLTGEGYIYLEVPNLMEVPRPFGPFLPSFHRTEFVPSTLNAVLRCTGFEPIESEAAYGIRVLARVCGRRAFTPPDPPPVSAVQCAFHHNYAAKRLGEMLSRVDERKSETLEEAAGLLRVDSSLREHFHWRLGNLETHGGRWHAGFIDSPESNWPALLADIVTTLRGDAQLASLLMMAGHSGLAIPGHLGRVTFRDLNVERLELIELAAANDVNRMREWIGKLMHAASVLHYILRLVKGKLASG